MAKIGANDNFEVCRWTRPGGGAYGTASSFEMEYLLRSDDVLLRRSRLPGTKWSGWKELYRLGASDAKFATKEELCAELARVGFTANVAAPADVAALEHRKEDKRNWRKQHRNF